MDTTFEQISFISEQQKKDEKHTALRLRERLLSERSLETFDDIEILSTILSYANGTKDTSSFVAHLLDSVYFQKVFHKYRWKSPCEIHLLLHQP